MSEFKAGQIWKYKTRKGEEDSRVYIVQVDNHTKYGRVYHISIDGLNIQNPELTGGVQHQVPHTAVNENALKDSLIELETTTTQPPDISIGYQLWVDSVTAGQTGIFNIQVKQLVQFIEDGVSH